METSRDLLCAEDFKARHRATEMAFSRLRTLSFANTMILLAKKETKYPQQVHHAVSFNAIKNQAFELLTSEGDSLILLERLESLFLMNPTVNRPDRIVPRIKRSARLRLNHVKRKLKLCF